MSLSQKREHHVIKFKNLDDVLAYCRMQEAKWTSAPETCKQFGGKEHEYRYMEGRRDEMTDLLALLIPFAESGTK